MTDSPTFAAATIQLLINPRMRSAFKQCRQRMEKEEKTEEFKQLAAVFRADAAAIAAAAVPRPVPVAADGTPVILPPLPPTPRFTLTFAQVQTLSKLFRATLTKEDDAASADLASDDASPGRGFVHELVMGSSIAALPPARSSRVQDPAFKRYLQEQRWKQERREYAELVKDLPGNKSTSREDGIGNNYASASRDIGHGVNILTLMVTGFIVFYYVGTNLFPHNHVFAVMTGLIGLIGALMVEVCLFLVREQKQEMGEAQQVKMARAQKKKEEETARRQAQQLKQQLDDKLAKIKKQQTEAQAEETKLD